MVQLCPGKAGFELAARHNDGSDLRLPQTCFVAIGLEECMRAAARHLSSCRIEGAQMRLEAKRKAAAGGGLCRFLDSTTDRSLSLRLWGRQGGRRSAIEGDSPYSEREATEKRPNSQN